MRTRMPFIAVIIFCLGCGSGGPFHYQEVQGTLTYEDGTPIPSGGIQLKFIALDVAAVEDSHPRPAIANLDAQGEFPCVTSYKYGDGLVPGKHKIAILGAKDNHGKLLVPKECTHVTTTPLIVDTADAPFEIKVPRP
jgi:hypothetical protein